VQDLGRDRVAAVAGVLFVVVFVVGQYVAPDLVYPEEQVGGVQLTFYVNYEHALLAQAILFGVASALLLVFVGGLRAFLARAEGQDGRLASVVVAAGAVAAGLVLVQAAIVVALTALRGNEVGVHAQGSAWAARALFYLEGAVTDMVLFPFAVLLAAAAVVLLRTRVLPAWLGWVGAALAVLLGVLGRRPGYRFACRVGHCAAGSGDCSVGAGLGGRAGVLAWLAAGLGGGSSRPGRGLSHAAAGRSPSGRRTTNRDLP
jgi:hypothetical protein